MKAILEFTLPDEADEFRAARRGADAVCVIEAVLEKLRGWLKHGHEFKSADEALEACRETMHRELDERTEGVTG